MALIHSQAMKKEAAPVADQKVAKEDIVVQNEAGQNIVVVPAGQPIPDDLDERKAAVGAVEDKAQRSSKGN